MYDNASGDETAAIVENIAKNDSRIEYHCRPKNVGLVRNIAYAVRELSTPFFHILCDDDLVFPGFFELAISALDCNSEALLFAGITIRARTDGYVVDVPLYHWRPGLLRPPEALFECIQSGHPDWTGVLFRRQVLTAVGAMDISIGNQFDFEFLCRITARRIIVASREPCGVLFVHSLSAGLIEADQGRYRPDVVVAHWLKVAANLNALEGIALKDKEAARKMILKRARGLLFRRACKAAIAGYPADAKAALSMIRESFGHAPEALAVALFNTISRGPIRVALNRTVEAARELRANRSRISIGRLARVEYQRAVRRLLGSVALDS